jgi:hypothetical protein
VQNEIRARARVKLVGEVNMAAKGGQGGLRYECGIGRGMSRSGVGERGIS